MIINHQLMFSIYDWKLAEKYLENENMINIIYPLFTDRVFHFMIIKKELIFIFLSQSQVSSTNHPFPN